MKNSAVIRLYRTKIGEGDFERAFFNTTFTIIYQFTLGENAYIMSRNKWIGRWEFLIYLIFFYSLFYFCFNLFSTQMRICGAHYASLAYILYL